MVVSQISLDGYQGVSRFTINPYNGLVYVYGGKSNIYIVDLQYGKVLRTISVMADDPLLINIPYDLGFTTSGYGIVLLGSNECSALLWKVIDSSKGDIIYPYEKTNHSSPKRVYSNFDKSKLLITDMWGGCDIYRIDGNTHDYERIIPSSITRGVFITPNKMNDRIYFGQLYDQFIMAENKTLSKISFLDNRSDAGADFSYRPGEEDYIYYWDDHYFRLLDYSTATTLFSSEVEFGLRSSGAESDRQLASTSDGKYLIVNCGALYMFKTEDFYHNLVKK
jgi:hypothetical protein